MSGPTSFVVNNEAQLNAAIAAFDIGGSSSATNTAYSILVAADFTLTANITAIDLAAGDTLGISGNDPANNPTAVIDGDDTHRGFVVDTGTVTLDSLDIIGMRASGGRGGNGAKAGGGGAGLGGGAFVASGATVALSNVSFSGDRASGGAGGTTGGTGAGAGGTTGLPGGFGDGGAGGVAGGFGGGGGSGQPGGFGGGANAGGGLAAGGDIFVQQGGVLLVGNGSAVGAGTVTGGGSSGGGAGRALGDGIFIQGSDSITLGTVTVTGVIADQSGAGGRGGVLIAGATTLSAANTYSGGTLIQSNDSLSLQGKGIAGTGAIGFTAPSGQLIIGAGAVPANLIDGFTIGDTIDLQGIGVATGTSLHAGNHLTVLGGTTGPLTLALDPAASYANDAFVLRPDGTGGSLLTLTQNHFTVASEADLDAALAEIDVGGRFVAPKVAYTITLTANLTLTSDPDAINLAAGDTLTFDGAGFAMDGGGASG